MLKATLGFSLVVWNERSWQGYEEGEWGHEELEREEKKEREGDREKE